MKKHKILLILILLLAFLLRFWRLDSYPALNADEAAIGYNAYSLIETGKDEHGNSWPLHFQSFNDYKPGLYFYLVLPFVKFIGLNEWAVRIPGALLGVATVYLVYLLVDELFGCELRVGSLKKKTNAQHIMRNTLTALIASFLLAISPWHIHFSRGGWEVNVATFFITFGVLLFIKAKKNLSILMLSFFSFALSLYTYHAARVIVPLLGLGLLFFYREFLKASIKNILLAGLIGLIVTLPLVKDFTKPEMISRAAGVGLFADTGPLERINEQRSEHVNYQGLVTKILHNKPINYGLAFLENWAEHYHGEFLFLSGDEIQRNKVPETGQMYIFDLLFLVAGLIFLLRPKGVNPYHPAGVKIIIWWLVVAPVAAALTFQSPHALRAQNMVIPLTIISAFGLVSILKWLGSFRKVIGCNVIQPVGLNRFTLVTFYCYLSLTLIVVWSFARYQHMYWTHMAKEYPFSSQYGVKELVSYVNENESKFDKVIISDKYDQPYILFLFYSKYSPKKFQESHELTERDQYGFSTVRFIDKYEFRPVNFDVDKPENPRSLIIGADIEIPDEANIVKEIYGMNGYKYFDVVAN